MDEQTQHIATLVQMRMADQLMIDGSTAKKLLGPEMVLNVKVGIDALTWAIDELMKDKADD